MRSLQHSWRRVAAVLGVLAMVLALGHVAASPVLADELRHDGSLVLIARGDAAVPAGEHRDAVIVFDGDASIDGEVNTVVVLNGTATLTGARVETLFVAGGTADVRDGSVVGQIRTLDAVYHAAPGTTVADYATVDPTVIAASLVPIAIATWLGVMLTFLVAGLVVAAVGGAQLRQAGAAMTEAPGQVIVGAIVSIVALPLLAVIAVVTVVGIPAAFALVFVALPLIWFLGIVAVAARLGDWLLLRLRGSVEPSHPLLATTLGLVIVGVASIVPFLSFVIGVFGMGAVAVVAWRAALSRRSTVVPSAPTPRPGAQPA